ncbi:MAG: hypothetical protein Q8Q12_20635 [bacterium]|nr:hypothetical protein [bacterium]
MGRPQVLRGVPVWGAPPVAGGLFDSALLGKEWGIAILLRDAKRASEWEFGHIFLLRILP